MSARRKNLGGDQAGKWGELGIQKGSQIPHLIYTYTEREKEGGEGEEKRKGRGEREREILRLPPAIQYEEFLNAGFWHFCKHMPQFCTWRHICCPCRVPSLFSAFPPTPPHPSPSEMT